MKLLAKLSLLAFISFAYSGCVKGHPPEQVSEATIEKKDCNEKLSEWQIFILALIEVESENNPNAIGKTKDGGVLQITPIYVKEANRVQNTDTFKLEDRFDVRKSIAMFMAVNDCHNKELDIDKAIKLHNPGAPASYKAKIKNKMIEISKRELIREYFIK